MKKTKKRQTKLDLVKREAKRLSEDKPGTDSYDVTLMMLSAATVGPCKRRVKKFMGQWDDRMEGWWKNLKTNKVFNGRYINAQWDDPEEGGIAFIMDTMIATGLLERAEG